MILLYCFKLYENDNKLHIDVQLELKYWTQFFRKIEWQPFFSQNRFRQWLILPTHSAYKCILHCTYVNKSFISSIGKKIAFLLCRYRQWGRKIRGKNGPNSVYRRRLVLESLLPSINYPNNIFSYHVCLSTLTLSLSPYFPFSLSRLQKVGRQLLMSNHIL